MNKWDAIFTEGKTFSLLSEILLSRLLEAIEKRAGAPPRTVIDLGCGTGDAFIRFAKRGLAVVGVDFSEVALGKARQALEKEGIASIDLRMMDLDDMHIQEKADIVFCKLTYAFVEDKERFLKNIRGLMQDSSVFVLMTPVLHKGVEYLQEDKPGIAVDFEETKNLLARYFTKSEIFHHDYLGAKTDLATFLSFV